MIGGFECCEEARIGMQMFRKMVSELGIGPDGVTTVSVLKACTNLKGLIMGMAVHGDADSALIVFEAMLRRNKSVHCITIRSGDESNELLLNSLMDAYAKCNDVELAWKLFRGKKIRDVVSWSNMIGASVELKRSNWAHGIAIRRGLAAQVAIRTAIVDMYSKCGAIGESRKAFGQICEEKKNIVSLSAMIAGYGMNGLGHEALSLLAEMKLYDLKPNAVTILSLLSACSHGGLIEEDLSLFASMVQNHEVERRLKHYTCVVDMLSRAGKLVTAMEFIRKVPESLMASGTSNAWGALLSACMWNFSG
ncbi:hypothetical protein ACFX2I_035116 [Malus domestica]